MDYAADIILRDTRHYTLLAASTHIFAFFGDSREISREIVPLDVGSCAD